MALTVVTPATTSLFCTTAQVKRDLDIANSTHDDLIDDLCAEVSQTIRSITQRFWPEERVLETFAGAANISHCLSRYPVFTVHSLAYQGAALDASQYVLEHAEAGIIKIPYGFRDTGIYAQGVTLEHVGDAVFDYACNYTAGWVMADGENSTLPAGVRRIARDAVRTLLLGRNAPANLQSKKSLDVSVEYSEGAFMRWLENSLLCGKYIG